jgi:ORF6N domain
MKQQQLLPSELIERRILLIWGERVMVDADLAVLYGVATKRLKERVKRNSDRFPPDFMFELTAEEKGEVVANCDHLRKLKYSPYLPLVFSEHGVLMLANVLNNPRAVEMSVQIVRTFVRLRALLAAHKALARQIEEMEKKYDSQFRVVFVALRRLLKPPEKPKRRIGFDVE